MLIANLVFYMLATVLVISALLVITAKNPVYSVLFLILAFFNSAGLFLMLGAELIAMLMVIVYVGAVAVLFLFVVMMLDVDFSKLHTDFMRYLPVGITVAVIMTAELFLVLNAASQSTSVIAGAATPNPIDVTNTKAIGMVLYTDYIYPFQISGLILLVAMIGAIVLTLRTRDGVKKQNINKQVGRTVKGGIEIVKVQSGKGV